MSAIAQVPVERVDAMQLPLAEGSADGEIPTSSWTEQPVQLLGNFIDRVLVGTTAASA